MVAGKVRLAMDLQKSPANPKKETPSKPPLSSSTSSGNKFIQVQPHPPDVAELLRVLEELRDRESKLETELLECKLLKESVSIVPVLENNGAVKNTELDRALKEI
ncbi:hypothetical protein F3Y22_tig00110122pilonHSYRG00138 [Hibiscus syriacus]|uniref:Uncharacterized protein n=1 Tax=Hibiscus syriacus TaxID=106335 RepID=A0A6A3BKI5_HIBSY|nr:hypothetical protein F3Y22_tig00110122pilonHSYRG00138 [Hibiscus syriacus]